MSIWTRLAAALAVIGDSIGAFLQQAASSRATPPEKSIAFTIGMIALSAKMAKADGIVSQVEILAFKQVFQIADDDLPSVARVFNLAKQDVAGFESYARQIARLFQGGTAILEDVLDGLFHIAKADDALHPAELDFLAQVASIFGFTDSDFRRIRARHVSVAGDPYAILDVDPGAASETIRRRYLDLVREYHPDRHIAAGVPEEMIEIATQRLQTVNAAYDQIMKERAL